MFDSYIKQDIDNLENCKGLAYNGTYVWLNDLGWLCVDIASDNDLTAAQESAIALLDLLKNGDDKLIIYSWGGLRVLKNLPDGHSWGNAYVHQLYLTGKKDFLSKKDVVVVEQVEAYGLTLVGSVRSNLPGEGGEPWPEDINPILHYDDWTGFSSSWGQVIKAWWDYSKSGN